MRLKLVCFGAILLTCLLIGAKFAAANTLCGVPESRILAYQVRILPFAAQIQSTLKRFNVDERFIWLAMIESGGDPSAESKRGAAGLWQLTKRTAKHYGCTEANGGRLNVDCSTTAAARYLFKLSKDFNGDVWKIVVSYNMGGANYRRIGKATNEARALANVVTCLMENRNYVFDDTD